MIPGIRGFGKAPRGACPHEARPTEARAELGFSYSDRVASVTEVRFVANSWTDHRARPLHRSGYVARMDDPWEFSQWASEDFGLPIIWCVALRRPRGMGLRDLCGFWHGYEAANNDEL